VKLSVLLPTRNGGRYLAACIRSILDQRDIDLELIVSDNASTDETSQVLANFAGDTRLAVIRQDQALAVTDNWNAALAASSGDWLLMMGDDDLLLDDYGATVSQLLAKHPCAECMTFNAYSYVAPGAISSSDGSYYADPHFAGPLLNGAPRTLGHAERLSIVRDMYRFTPRLPLNMQTTIVSRKAMARVTPPMFRPPFPDHYALCALLLRAGDWVASPAKPLVIGVTEKSFGHYVYSNDQDAGLSYLGIELQFPNQLPGDALINAMHMWLSRLKVDYPLDLALTDVSRPDYVLRQVGSWVQQRRAGILSTTQLLSLARSLSSDDLRSLARGLARRENLQRIFSHARRLRDGQALRRWAGLRPLPQVGTISEFARWIGEARVD